MKEDKLAKELETYRQLAKNDKKIDVASLAISAMLQQESNRAHRLKKSAGLI
ncbi:MAG: hypothetical protein WDN47_00695 [Candidatus Doudnabacteria bacterium]